MSVHPVSSLPATVAALRRAGCVFAEDEALLLHEAAASPGHLSSLVEHRVAGLPLEHVLGWAEFCGRRLAVDAGVFVPRRRTEFLVAQAAALAPERAVVVDLCCGSGALGVALATEASTTPGRVDLHACDVEPAAVRCARRNIGDLGQVYEGDLFDPLPAALRGRVDVLLANVPYVPTADVELLPAEARVHEPRVALDGGGDGLDVMRRVAAEAPGWLAPGGSLLVEASERQRDAAVQVLRAAGLVPRVVVCEELYATVVIGTAGRTTCIT
ncbi:SAM-dependent methyltransferase [Streptomyces sp. CB00316]|uniref:putative protein N(5)-glutamine methyltransferase n=1 Tax=unclassified Streptomyces TaxID=2593676 RepID=UPI00093A9CE4|nr:MULTISPECIES: putative protein N(5)-glutamine methyltransferase [unclassified Streptomyces]MBT2429487.1 putative protein N(5)-glutamine methyltransferase [Streptomyces sp. ISL-112]MBT2463402.1 putative protein N(5)-glutamine methyltransferase [Streptomyces sp. ISL-63]OKJ24044.1 SAM-dependent methyltransferase [Streptomyces sp. CB00316]